MECGKIKIPCLVGRKASSRRNIQRDESQDEYLAFGNETASNLIDFCSVCFKYNTYMRA